MLDAFSLFFHKYEKRTYIEAQISDCVVEMPDTSRITFSFVNVTGTYLPGTELIILVYGIETTTVFETNVVLSLYYKEIGPDNLIAASSSQAITLSDQ